MAEFPNASTTGVRDGVTLTPSGGITIDTAGAVVSGLNITGDVVITAPNVTLVDCRVTGSIIVQSTGATIEYVDAVGRNSLNTIDINPNGRAGEGDNTTVRFCDISGSENGIWLEGDGCLIEDNYIHNLFSNTGASDPHIDGIQIPGKYSFTTTTENVIIRHNNIDLDVRTASASITMKDGINIDIIDNRLSGGSAVIYFEGDSRDCDVINNVFDEYAYFHIAGASWQEQAYSGNTDEATGSLLSFNDDPTAPAIPATPAITSFSADSGTAGDRITNDNTLALVGTAAANSTVRVFDGSTQIGTATANSSGAWSVTTAALADGSHSLTATATNSGGTSGTSAPLLVTVDTAAPSAPTIHTSTSAESLASANVEVLTGTAEAGSTVTVFDGATRLGAVTADASGAWSYTSGVLSVGSHSFTARATDVAGNTGASSSAAVVTIADAPEPVPEPGGTPDPGSAPELSIHITYLQQSRSGVTKLKGMADPGAVVELLDGSTSLGSAVAGADGSWAFSKSGLSKTVHSITAQEVDGSGQVVAKSSGAALLGSTRNDTLTGTTGNDVLLSNGGNDTFVFNENFGRDVIRDFDSIGRSHDVVQFGTSVFDSFASVLEHASQVGRDVVITAGTDELTLKNTKLSTLDSHDFHFA
jgi:hypothetical protein